MKRLKITFGEPQDISPPGLDGVEYSFPLTVVEAALEGTPEARTATREHRVIVRAARSRLVGWHLSPSDLAKVLFWFGKRYVSQLVTTGSLPEAQTIRMPMITSVSHPDTCPLDPAAIPAPHGFTTVEEQPTPFTITSTMKSQIFVSYARPDLRLVRSIVRFLNAAGFPTWFDHDNLLAGHDWRHVIKQEIANSRLLLLCLSTNSVDRTGFFQKEMRLAIEQAELRPQSKVFIMPVRLNACSIPDAIAGWHVLDLFAQRATDRLLAAIADATGEGASAPISEHEDLINAISDYNRDNPA